jgi:integrase/recombinase XerD
MDKETNTEYMGQERNKEESFRQIASFADKILLNEGMFTRYSDDHDIRKMTRARIESMLYATNLGQSEAPLNIHIGREGINKWIWENKVVTEIPTAILKSYLYRNMKKDPKHFYSKYIIVLDLVQKLAAYLKISPDQIVDGNLMSVEVLSYLSASFAASGLKRQMIAFIVRCASNQQREPKEIKKYKLMFPQAKNRHENRIHPKVQEYLRQLTKEGKTKHTKCNCIRYLNMLLPWLINNIVDVSGFETYSIPIFSIKEVHLMEFRAYLLKKQQKGEYSPITTSECIYSIKNFFRFLTKTYGFPDPSKRLKSIKAPRYRFRNLPSEDQINAFLGVIETYSEDPLLERIAFQFMITLGMRSMEVVQISWKDINMAIRTICIHSKGGKYHELPLAGQLYHDLKMFGETRSSSMYLFDDDPKKFLRELRQNYKIYSLIAGWTFPGGLHLFRHAFVTNLASKNSPPQALQALARVIKLDTVSLYCHLNQRTNRLSQEVNKLDYSYTGGK